MKGRFWEGGCCRSWRGLEAGPSGAGGSWSPPQAWARKPPGEPTTVRRDGVAPHGSLRSSGGPGAPPEGPLLGLASTRERAQGALVRDAGWPWRAPETSVPQFLHTDAPSR